MEPRPLEPPAASVAAWRVQAIRGGGGEVDGAAPQLPAPLPCVVGRLVDVRRTGAVLAALAGAPAGSAVADGGESVAHLARVVKHADGGVEVADVVLGPAAAWAAARDDAASAATLAAIAPHLASTSELQVRCVP